MKPLDVYSIPFPGLKVGKHEFTYEIDGKFFENFEYSPIKDGDVYVHLTFDKRETFFVLSFFIDGSVIAECDRCMEDFELPINGNYTTFVKYENEEDAEGNDEVMLINDQDIIINVANLIYENINLSLPLHKTCDMSVLGKKSCNPEILKILKEKASQEEKPDAEPIDPRWEKLRNLNKK